MINWTQEGNISYGLKASDIGFGYGIFKNNSNSALHLQMTILGTGIQIIEDKAGDMLDQVPNKIEYSRQATIEGNMFEVIIFESRARSINASLSFEILNI